MAMLNHQRVYIYIMTLWRWSSPHFPKPAIAAALAAPPTRTTGEASATAAAAAVATTRTPGSEIFHGDENDHQWRYFMGYIMGYIPNIAKGNHHSWELILDALFSMANCWFYDFYLWYSCQIHEWVLAVCKQQQMGYKTNHNEDLTVSYNWIYYLMDMNGIYQ